jgi:hypothetical protein
MLREDNTTQRGVRTSHRVPKQLQDLASYYRLSLIRDSCGESIIPGRNGQLYAYDHAIAGITVSFDSKRAWSFARKKLLLAGFSLFQNCDTEGSATFNHQNPNHVKLALRLAGIKARRRVSSETLARLAAFSRARKVIAGTPVVAIGATIKATNYSSLSTQQPGQRSALRAMTRSTEAAR